MVPTQQCDEVIIRLCPATPTTTTPTISTRKKGRRRRRRRRRERKDMRTGWWDMQHETPDNPNTTTITMYH